MKKLLFMLTALLFTMSTLAIAQDGITNESTPGINATATTPTKNMKNHKKGKHNKSKKTPTPVATPMQSQ